MSEDKRLSLSLLLLRVSVFIVLLMWTIDKFARPEHASQVYETFYNSPGFGATVSYLIGGAELIIILGFLLGFKKTFTYGAVLLFHAISTFASFRQYFAPFESVNLLFFAAWPMLAACVTLFLLRDRDTMLSIE